MGAFSAVGEPLPNIQLFNFSCQRKSWKRRFFALDDFTICYFKCEQVSAELGAFLGVVEDTGYASGHTEGDGTVFCPSACASTTPVLCLW